MWPGLSNWRVRNCAKSQNLKKISTHLKRPTILSPLVTSFKGYLTSNPHLINRLLWTPSFIGATAHEMIIAENKYKYYGVWVQVVDISSSEELMSLLKRNSALMPENFLLFGGDMSRSGELSWLAKEYVMLLLFSIDLFLIRRFSRL